MPAITNHDEKEILGKMGGILHRIAEVMYSDEVKPQSKASKGYMKPKKTFAF